MSNIYDAYGILALAATPASAPRIFGIILPKRKNNIKGIQFKIDSNEYKKNLSLFEYITAEPYDFMFETYWALEL